LLILGGVLACISIVLVAAAWALLNKPKETPPSTQSPPVESKPEPPKPAVVAEKKSPPPKTKKPAKAEKPAKATAAAKVAAADTKPLWESPTDGRPLNLAINLDVPREIVLDRLAGRRVCENCQRVYHVNMPPKSNWICDTCGGTVVQRDDDTAEAIDRRLELYEQETVPIIEYYRSKGMLAEVDGVGDGDDVFDRLVKAVNERVPNDSA